MTTQNLLQIKTPFDSTSTQWETVEHYNLLFTQTQENYANDLLTIHGYVFLNEVLDMFGIARTAAGVTAGWIRENGPISFEAEETKDAIILTFNVIESVIDHV